jgi:hypothetical protein
VFVISVFFLDNVQNGKWKTIRQIKNNWGTQGWKLMKSSLATASHRDREKGYPKHKCCEKNEAANY